MRSFSLTAIGASEAVSTPPAMPTSIAPTAILSATAIAAWIPVSQACWMSYAGVSGLSREPEHALAGQVEVPAVLEHGAGDDLAEPLPAQAEPVDEPVDRGGEHVLVDACAYAALDRANGIRLPPRMATRRMRASRAVEWSASVGMLLVGSGIVASPQSAPDVDARYSLVKLHLLHDAAAGIGRDLPTA